MKKSIKNVAVLFSLVFTLVLSAGVTTVTTPDANANDGISTCVCNDLPFDGGVEY